VRFAWLLPAIFCVVGPGAALAQSAATQADSSAVGPADSLANLETQLSDTTSSGLAAATAAAMGLEDPGDGDQPFLVSWDIEPKAGLKATVRKVEYYGDLVSNQNLTDSGKISENLSIAREEFRKQDKNVDRRDASMTFTGGDLLPFTTSIRTSWAWNEDRTINSAGQTNLIRRD